MLTRQTLTILTAYLARTFVDNAPPAGCSIGRWARLERQALHLHHAATSLAIGTPLTWPPDRVADIARAACRMLDVLGTIDGAHALVHQALVYLHLIAAGLEPAFAAADLRAAS